MKKVIAIIQARLASARLPGKVLKTVEQKSMIEYMIEQLYVSKYIEKIVFAIPSNDGNLELKNHLIELGVEYFEGPEENVLERFYQTALKVKADKVMRLTADCPLIDSELCDDLIYFHHQNNYDYCYLSEKFAEGLDCEVMNTSCLKVAYENASSCSQKEHVTLFFHENPQLFSIGVLNNLRDDSEYRITLDEPEDFEVIKVIIENLKEKNRPIGFLEIKDFLDKNKNMKQFNSHIMRNEGLLNSLEQDKKKVLKQF